MSNFLTDDTENDGLNLNPDIDDFEIPKDEYTKILNSMFMTFMGKTKECDTEERTEAYCRSVLKQCSTCFKADGNVWRNPPGKNASDWYEKLSLRLRVYGYDISTQSLIGRRESKVSSKIKDMGKKKEDKDSNDRSFSLRETAAFEGFIEKFKSDFEGSTTVSDNLMIRRLAFLSVLNDRDIERVSLSRDLTKEIKELADSLGVSGKQRKTTMNSEGSGTMELLSTKFKQTLEEHVELESLWKFEEIKLIFNAVKRGTTEEFLALSWFKILYGNDEDGKPITMDRIERFIKESKYGGN